MKLPTFNRTICQMAAFTFLMGSTATPLWATPQALPEGDGEISDFIEMDLSHDSFLSGAGLQVQVRDGIARLTGEVDSLSQAERAAARTIGNVGVRAVVNELQVRPKSATAILKGAKAAMAGQEMINRDRIKVSVSGQRISLNGSVGSPDERELAREIVSEVPGAVAVENQLIIAGSDHRADSQIASHLRFLIRRDPFCDGLDLAVGVKSGSVEIRGDVGSSGEINRLMRRCHVEGVTSFRTTGLRVNRDLAMEGFVEKDYSKGESILALRDALRSDSRIGADRITAAMNDGEITLTGQAVDLAESDVIAATARAIPGVRSVVNKIDISGPDDPVAGLQDIQAASPPLVRPRR